MNNERLIYLTYGDMDSPVFETQVVGFCDFLKEQLDIDVQIVSFVPMRLYADQKERLQAYGRDIKVYPVINRFQSKKWYSRLNARLICKMGGATIMCRNPSAAELVKELKSQDWKYIYDARGCQYVEMREFSDADATAIEEMKSAEVACFRAADWVYSVSNALVEYFKDEHRYREHTFSVVPCCINTSHSVEEDSAQIFKRLLPTADSETKVYCYAGSLGVWNFPPQIIDLFRGVLKEENVRLVILSKDIDKLMDHRFLANDERVVMRSVDVKEVKEWLSITDYSLLLRKRAITNRLASPSKFAEYLCGGTKVIISPEIGDLSAFVEAKGCGVIYRNKKDNSMLRDLKKLTASERANSKQLAAAHFDRRSELNMLKYRNLKTVHQRMYNDLRAENG